MNNNGSFFLPSEMKINFYFFLMKLDDQSFSYNFTYDMTQFKMGFAF